MGRKTLNFGNSVKTISKEIDLRSLKTKRKDSDRLSLDDIKIDNNFIVYTHSKSQNCINCMGRTLLCGKSHCPIITQFSRFKPLQKDFSSKVLFGSSPPSVFIGRNGFPNVFVGPMVPPSIGDTAIMDETELWWNMDLTNIIDMRMNLVRCKSSLNIYSAKESNRRKYSNKNLDNIQEIGLANNSIEMEVKFSKLPKKNIILDADIQPMGPSAPIRKIKITSNSTDQKLQKIADDTDLNANSAIINLKNNNSSQTSITRAFSAGLMGLGKNRRLVPTRWAITAVDSSLGLHYWKKIIHFPIISEYRVYESNYLDNKFVIIMMPGEWGYELIEAFFPGSCWNPGEKIAMGNDWEGLKGRKTYSRIGGCYYAARNMIGEYLHQNRRQAKVVILRETYPNFTMPLGVWFTRECVRNALEQPYLKFDTSNEVIQFVDQKMKIPASYWIDTSGVLKKSKEISQKSIYRYL
ncbi:MAG: hypothetical protein HeimC3_19230 [Candidatus Heimdallarchaeota archaeon LC_3]|nr:MAG: hypothetical protein HeimC3_19230 [Candidatus Heimdallarchaeota archaeon LC_3]